MAVVTTSPDRLLVTVESSAGPATLELPLDVEVAELLPGIVRVTGHDPSLEGWSLRQRDGQLVEPDRTLRHSGILRGAILRLIDPLDWPGQVPTLDSTGAPGLLPNLSTWHRLRSAFAALGFASQAHAGPAAQPRQDRRPHMSRMPPPVPPAAGVIDHRSLRFEPALGPWARARRAWRESEYSWRLRHTVVTARPVNGMLIAVAALESGSGTSSVTALLATALSALRRERTVIVDTGRGASALSDRLAAEQRLTEERFERLGGRPVSFAEFESFLARGPESTALLPAPMTGVGSKTTDIRRWSGLLVQMSRWMPAVIVDCGAGLVDAASEAALMAADLVILVGSRDYPSLDHLAPAASRLRRPDRDVVLVASHLRSGLVLWPPALCPAGCPLVSVPHSPHAADTVRSAGPVWPQLPARWQIAGSELAAVVVARRG